MENSVEIWFRIRSHNCSCLRQGNERLIRKICHYTIRTFVSYYRQKYSELIYGREFLSFQSFETFMWTVKCFCWCVLQLLLLRLLSFSHSQGELRKMCSHSGLCIRPPPPVYPSLSRQPCNSGRPTPSLPLPVLPPWLPWPANDVDPVVHLSYLYPVKRCVEVLAQISRIFLMSRNKKGR